MVTTTPWHRWLFHWSQQCRRHGWYEKHSIGATTVGTRGDWSPTCRLWTNNVLVSHLLGRSFQKTRNFTASIVTRMHRFSIWVFKKFPGVIPPDPHSGRGRPLPALNTQPGLWPGAASRRPGVGTQTLVPLNFSAVVAPLKRSLKRHTTPQITHS